MQNKTFQISAIAAVLISTACGGSDAGERPDSATAAVSAENSAPSASGAFEAIGPAATEERGTPSAEPSISATPSAPSGASRASGNEVVEVSQVAADPTAEAILGKAEQAYSAVRSMEADFVQNLTVPLLGSKTRSRGKIFHRRPDRFRMQFAEPAGDLVLADGKFLWMYYPSTDATQVIRTALTDGTVQQVDFQQQFLSNAVERFDARLVGTEEVNGRAVRVLVLVPTGDSQFQRVKLWVDSRDSLVRRFEITEANGTIREITLSNLEPNVPLSDELFNFTPPPGTQVFTQ